MIKQHKKYNALGIWHNLVTQSKYYKNLFFIFSSDMNPSINLQWWKYNLQNHSPMLFLSCCSAMSSRGPWWLFLVSTSYPHCSQLEGKRKRWWYDPFFDWWKLTIVDTTSIHLWGSESRPKSICSWKRGYIYSAAEYGSNQTSFNRCV